MNRPKGTPTPGRGEVRLSRYPGRRAIRYNRERANRCLESSRKIVEWVKRLEDP
ncbi:MAG: hypothetical protein RQ885_10590 [Desulfurococcales archaeon]|jgi:HEPN domain-containing protein|nr:hypothetical protein [Desulfurococcales archaeon]